MHRHGRLCYWWLLAAVIFSIAGWSILDTAIGSHPELWCEAMEIDINSGHLRRRSYVFFIETEERIEDTWISKSLAERDTSHKWKHVKKYTAPFGRDAYRCPEYYCVLSQLDRIEALQDIVTFDFEARQAFATCVLRLWREKASGPDWYIDEMAGAALELRRSGRGRLTLDDLPKCAEEQPILGDQPAGT